ncbi:uncharacterized protein LOC121382932 isoform X2 [Gigantopelta aegis]|uniref:uncharacterized protein LOC121382932 isoform X2 n=1 Tax=Gigantopelta aegis TaxID=1735272 RepID=UPI001B88B267|nr:uncharacterized protein LOC121382932 isoform X2 [Gigantopelta aegis]XP_041368550.1 uncharacterized protein LOC121382932 isoform X2 [Gigantopelta aegis]XP_041368551.1 uncharacterized protein LOC121382932 isoform X2 [Gigantopelta aegis]
MTEEENKETPETNEDEIGRLDSNNKETPETNEEEIGRLDSDNKETSKTKDDDVGIKTWVIIGFGGLWILLLLGILIGAVVVGSTNRFDCYADFRVPIWLLVTGTVPISMLGGLTCRDTNDTCHKWTRIIFVSIVVLFMFSWLIVGTVWFVNLKSTLESCDSPSKLCSKCHQDVLSMSLAVLIIEWFTVVVAFCASGAVVVYTYFFKKEPDNTSETV